MKEQSLDDVTKVGAGLARRLAASQLAAVEQYGDALKQYADGKIEATEFGKNVLNLAYREAARTAEGAFKLGVEYYTWLFSLAGVKLGAAAGKQEQPQRHTAARSARSKA